MVKHVLGEDCMEDNVKTKDIDVLMVGGGSGGHITPLIAVAEQLLTRDASLKIAHVGQRGDRFNTVLRRSAFIVASYEVSAGKFRRYNGESWLNRLLDVKTNFLNMRDVVRVFIGLVQSWFLLKKMRPRVILARGGYVGVPVCLAARMLGIPYVTHDSDAMVSLANRIIGKDAVAHATALPAENYPAYDSAKIVQVGVPVRSEFVRVTPAMQASAKRDLGYDYNDQLLLVVGGGLGAQNVNNAVVADARKMLERNSRLKIMHVSGEKLEAQVKNAYKKSLSSSQLSKAKVIGFSHELHAVSAAADVVVTRAGATNMAEFAAQGKACIVVPSPLLAGGHQLKNAEVYKQKKAAVVIAEEDLQAGLSRAVERLMSSEEVQKQFGDRLHELFVPEAAAGLADLLLKTMKDD